MRAQHIGPTFVLLGLSAIVVQRAGADDSVTQGDAEREPAAATAASRTPRQTIERGLSFLVDDVVKWRADRGCATCHHGTMTVWAISEAKAQGYSVAAEPF